MFVSGLCSEPVELRRDVWMLKGKDSEFGSRYTVHVMLVAKKEFPLVKDFSLDELIGYNKYCDLSAFIMYTRKKGMTCLLVPLGLFVRRKRAGFDISSKSYSVGFGTLSKCHFTAFGLKWENLHLDPSGGVVCNAQNSPYPNFGR